MNKKIIFSGLLLLTFTLGGCNSQAGSQNAELKETASVNQLEVQNEASKVDRIEVFYFHSTRRCFSCQTLEQFTKLTMEEYYQPQMRDGIIVFNSFNVEDEENKEIVQRFKATGSSLFINVVEYGKDSISQDTQVWRLLGNQTGFKQYLKAKIDSFLQ